MPSRKSRRLLLIGFVLLICHPVEGRTATRRALLVGINTYTKDASPGEKTGRNAWFDLDGAVNDVETMREILISRYGFGSQNILVLKNSEATRDGILGALRSQLIAPSARGDLCVFYYAGHGSQVRNSKSDEPDKKDETIVPADANRGAWDIRDKELRRVFNDIIDKGAHLTVLLDSCHSGSAARGLTPPGKSRFLAEDPRDVAELATVLPPDPRPAPAERGALIFSAAQDHQTAVETVGGRDTPHGLFSLALFKTLRTASAGEPANRLLLKVKALMQAEGYGQEPVLSGATDRPLFGAAGEALAARTTAAVRAVSQDGVVDLQGGLAIGLNPGCELRKSDAPSGASPVRLRVEAVDGLARSTAVVIEGDPKKVQSGDLFELDRWTAPDEPFLRVWLPPTLPFGDLAKVAKEISVLRHSDRIRWVTDPTAETPTHVMFRETGGWKLARPGGGMDTLGAAPSAKAVLEKILSGATGTPRFFLSLPPTPEMADHLRFDSGKMGGAIELAARPERAHYVLVGRTDGEKIEYAWVLPDASRNDMQTAASLPVRTDWLLAGDQDQSAGRAGQGLKDFAVRIARLRAWLQLPTPPDDVGFPYQLALKNGKTTVRDGGVVHDGESLRMVLDSGGRKVERGLARRYVYVFAIDSAGRSELLFGRGNVDNQLPYEGPDHLYPGEIDLGCSIGIAPPFGLDTYFLLTSVDPIPDPEVLVGPAIKNRGPGESPLAILLSGIGTGTRGVRLSTPLQWSLERLSVQSLPAPR